MPPAVVVESNPAWAAAGWLTTAAYLLAPTVLILVAWRRPTLVPRATAVVTFIVGVVVGAGLAAMCGHFIAGSPRAVPVGQYAVAAYLGVALLSLLKGADAAVRWAGRKVVAEPSRSLRAAALFGRVLLLAAVGLPWVMAAAMTFRVKVVPGETPPVPFDRVELTAADGMRVVGWWVPAGTDSSVVLVPGLGSGKADLLPAVVMLARGGHNVLVIDPRAHGESGGQTTSFGDLERLDALAAVAWLRENEPAACETLHAVGVSMGGAAAIGAAAELAGRGEPLDGLVVIDSYDRLPRLARTLTDRQFKHVPALSWAARAVAVPLASAHAGRPLGRAAPADWVAGVWPTPTMVVHSDDDEVIPFALGRSLFEAVEEPRRSAWVDGLDHGSVAVSPDVLRRVLDFLETAAAWEPSV